MRRTGISRSCFYAAAVATAIGLAGTPLAVRAQGGLPPKPQLPQQPQQPVKNPMRTAEDSARARKDSLKNEPLVRWEPVDSVGESLMRKPGFRIVRYKADEVVFGASDKQITLVRKGPQRAAVQSEPTTLVADTIPYSDTATTDR